MAGGLPSIFWVFFAIASCVACSRSARRMSVLDKLIFTLRSLEELFVEALRIPEHVEGQPRKARKIVVVVTKMGVELQIDEFDTPEWQ